MTFNEMRSEAELLYESINSSAAPGFTDEEWGQLLTIGQRRVVLRILEEGVNKNAFNQLAIEKIIQRDEYDDFTTDLHFKNSTGTPAQTLLIVAPGKPFDTDFFWIVDEYVKTVATDNIPLKRITFDFYRSNLRNPFRVPDVDENFWVLQYNGLPIFITDGAVITGYYIVGVEHPDKYPIGPGIFYPDPSGTEASVLNESVHSKIVEEAVTLARMSVVDAQGYQLALAEFAK